MVAGKERIRRAGYSLIELIVSIFIMGLLLTSLATALIYCNQYLRTSETKSQAENEALMAAVWLSRYLQDANITAMVASQTTTDIGISFQSVRDPYNTSVTFAPGAAGGGVITWPQNVAVYLAPDPMDPTGNVLQEKSIPNAVDTLDPPQPLDIPTAKTNSSNLQRVLAHNIRAFQVSIYNPNNPADEAPPAANSTNTVNITIEAYAPYYGLNYGVNVSTSIRPQN